MSQTVGNLHTDCYISAAPQWKEAIARFSRTFIVTVGCIPPFLRLPAGTRCAKPAFIPKWHIRFISWHSSHPISLNSFRGYIPDDSKEVHLPICKICKHKEQPPAAPHKKLLLISRQTATCCTCPRLPANLQANGHLLLHVHGLPAHPWASWPPAAAAYPSARSAKYS